VYAPTKDNPSDQKQFLDSLKEKLELYEKGTLIIAGDFNICLNPTLDKSGERIEKLSEFAKLMISFMDEFDLVDIWRIRNPDTRRYTWRQRTKAGIVHSRLDFFLVSLELSYSVRKSEIDIGICSDHSIINISLNENTGESRGKSFWKLNVSLLKDETYISKDKECKQNSSKKFEDVHDKGLL
jgi:exonuclease III